MLPKMFFLRWLALIILREMVFYIKNNVNYRNYRVTVLKAGFGSIFKKCDMVELTAMRCGR